MAYHKSYTIQEQTNLDSLWLLQKLQPVCDFISIYNGPVLKEFHASDKTTLIGNKNNFSFNLTTHEAYLEFNFFEKGEKHFQVILQKKQFQFTLEKIYSDTTHNSILNQFESIVNTLNPIIEPTITKPDSDIQVPKSFESALENQSTHQSKIVIHIHNQYKAERRYILLMNDICQLISSNACPAFSDADINYQDIQLTHETYRRINLQSNDFDINYVDYEYDTGHWNSSKGGHITFTMSKKNQQLFNSEIKSSSIYIYLNDEVRHFYEKIKQLSLSYFSF